MIKRLIILFVWCIYSVTSIASEKKIFFYLNGCEPEAASDLQWVISKNKRDLNKNDVLITQGMEDICAIKLKNGEKEKIIKSIPTDVELNGILINFFSFPENDDPFYSHKKILISSSACLSKEIRLIDITISDKNFDYISEGLGYTILYRDIDGLCGYRLAIRDKYKNIHAPVEENILIEEAIKFFGDKKL